MRRFFEAVKAMPQRQPRLPVVETDRLAQQQPRHHQDQQDQITLVTARAVLTQEGDQLGMEHGAGKRGGLAWCRNPKPARLHAPFDVTPLIGLDPGFQAFAPDGAE